MNDARRLHLPLGRLFRIILAGLAGGIDAVLQHRVIALRAVGALRGETGIVGRLEPERIDKSVAIIVGEIDDLPVGDPAVRLGQPGISLGAQPLGFLVVDDLVRLDGGPAVIDLHVADGGDGVVWIIVSASRPLERASACWRARGGGWRRFATAREMHLVGRATIAG